MLAEGLATFLKDDSDISALVDGRVYPLRIPQRVGKDQSMPCLVYQRVGAVRNQSFCGTDQLVAASYQIDSYAIRYQDAVQLSEAVAVVLLDYTGDMGDTHVDRVFLESEIDLNDIEPGLYRVSQTYIIWHKEEL